MYILNKFLVFNVLCVSLIQCIYMPIFNGNSLQTTDPCYDERGNAKRCIPDFVNAAYGQIVQVFLDKFLKKKTFLKIIFQLLKEFQYLWRSTNTFL